MKPSTIALAMFLAAGAPAAAQNAGSSEPFIPPETVPTVMPSRSAHALEFSPMSPMFHIYAVQYAYHFDEKNVLIAGLSYADIPQKPAEEMQPSWMDVVITPNTMTKDIGVNHSWTLFVGYKRYVWNGLHLEYQLWPGYNAYWSNTEQKYYRGFDLWNEFRVGYTVDFGNSPFYANLQYLIGFALVRGNKPADFGEGGQPVFRAPVVFIGWRF
jgi:hypothetical protein